MDKEYLNMVLALPDDFFENWRWKAGDKGLIISEEREVIMLGQTGQLIWYYDRGDLLFNPEYVKNDIATIEINYIRPLPNQEQLQEMLITFHITHNKFSRKRAILHIMGHWADYLMRKHNFEYDKIDRNQDYEYFGNPEDFDILMLRFTVGIILMLGWNGSSWEKMV